MENDAISPSHYVSERP